MEFQEFTDREDLIDYLETNYNTTEQDRYMVLERVLTDIFGSDDFSDDDPIEGLYADFSTEELKSAKDQLDDYFGDNTVYLELKLNKDETRLLNKMLSDWSDPSFSKDASKARIAHKLFLKLQALGGKNLI